jgi:hypothetical protein
LRSHRIAAERGGNMESGMYRHSLDSPQVNLQTRTNSANRVESVAFDEPGIYLVICNVTPHFTDGMYACVRVTGQSK